MANEQLPLLGVDSQSYSQCNRCGESLPISNFYVSDLNRCKECVKVRVRANRAEKIDYYRLYDRQRYREDDARKEVARKSATSPAGIAAKNRATARSRRENPEKSAARNKVSNAIRAGKLVRGAQCYFCASNGKLQAHHYDYSKPLDVFWLCPPCHGKLHTVNGDFHRPKHEVL